MKVGTIVTAFLFWAFSMLSAKYMSTSVPNGGSISGKVIYAGEVRPPKKIVPTSDKVLCEAHGPIFSEELIIDSLSGVKNVVVTLLNITQGKPMLPVGYAELDQRGCTFRPHVLIVPTGQKLKVLNSDGIVHNLHSHSILNPTINLAQPGSVKEMELQPFSTPELIQVTCDVHGWMSSYIWVTEHPYVVVSGEDGSYEITEIPEGKYRIEFWHETLGKHSREIRVTKGKVTKLNVVFMPKGEIKPK